MSPERPSAWAPEKLACVLFSNALASLWRRPHPGIWSARCLRGPPAGTLAPCRIPLEIPAPPRPQEADPVTLRSDEEERGKGGAGFGQTFKGLEKL